MIRDESLFVVVLVVVINVDVLDGSVIGFLLVVAVVFGRLVVLRVTEVDLTVEVLIVGFDVVVVGSFVASVELVLSSDST